MSRIINPATAPKYFNAGIKVGWAKHHLRLLDAEIRDFLAGDPKPYSFSTEDDLQAGEYVIRFDLEPLPITLALMAGDFAACLRGSLDHLATALTECRGGTYNERASFPVIGVANSASRKSFDLSLKGVPTAAVKIIESLQPYHAGHAYKTSKLWRLHRLWNIDKHRRIPLQYGGIQMQCRYPPEMPPLADGSDNSGIVRFSLSAKPYVQLNPAMKFSVNFGDESEGISIPSGELEDMYHLVRDDVMPRFKSFF